MTAKTFDRSLLVARILIASLFLVGGVLKLSAYSGTQAYFAKLGIPVPHLVTPLTVFVELGGGLLLIKGWQTRWVAPVLAAYTLGTAMIGHAFWSADAAQFNAQLSNFLKNMAIVGAFIILTICRSPSRTN